MITGDDLIVQPILTWHISAKLCPNICLFPTNAKLPGLECVGAVPGNIYEELCKILSNIHSLPASNDRL